MKPNPATKSPKRSLETLFQTKSTSKKKQDQDIFISYLGKSHAGKRIEGINFLDPEDEISQVIPGETHIFMINKENKILGVGQNNYGQLSQNKTRDIKIPTNLLLKEKIGVSNIYSGANFVYAVTSKYEVFSWGSNIKGQLGQGHYNDLDIPTRVNTLTHLVKTGNSQSLSFNECILNLNEIIVDIACGPLHALALTSDNRIMTTGFGETYALGHGRVTTSSNFQEISYFAGFGQKIDKIACGVSHSACLTNGRVYVWGRLGLSKAMIHKKPNLIVIKEDIGDFALGDMNTILLSTKGEVYTLGENIDCQLGHKSTSSITPTKIKLPIKIEYITCGLNHVIAISISKSKIIAWGSNRYGQLKPHSNELWCENPQELDWIRESIPLSITCAYFQTYVISKCQTVSPKQVMHNHQQLVELKKEIESFKMKHLKLIKENDKLKDEIKTLYSTLSNIDKTEEKTNQNDETIKRYKTEIRKTRTLMPNYEIDYRELRFGDKLSEGAFGIVYKGMWRDLKVAIKTLKPKYLKEETIKDFLSNLNR